MIRRLALENWRNYTTTEILFGVGTTFVVASNGVGKTSLVEAARWALFGSVPPTNPARLGTKSTSVTVDLMLPDSTVLTVTRTWDRRKTRPVHTATYVRDNIELSPDEWPDLCADVYGCSPDLLERLTMPSLGPSIPTNLGLHDHLSALYGVDNLTLAANRLSVELRAVAKEIAEVKAASALKASELEQLQVAVTHAEQQTRAARQQLADAEAQLGLARKRDEQLERSARRKQQLAELSEAEANLLPRLKDLLGVDVNAADAAETLSRRLQDAKSNLDALRLERQVIAGRRQDIERDLADLDAATDDCPTCRRPLDDTARQHAHQLWREELSELDRRETAAQGSESAARHRVAELEAITQESIALTQRAAALEAAPEETPISAHTSPEATQHYREAAEAQALAEDNHQRAILALREAIDADENMRRLERLFATEARLEIARSTAESTRDEILAEVVTPLGEAIDLSWAGLFPGRGKVRTGPDGALTRAMGDDELSFDAFSTAESTAALIIMRLLVAQMTTTADFAWFDEPLEHLDPDVRRNVATLLAKVTNAGKLIQVVVTTYEETLARKLHEQTANRTGLLDVRYDMGTYQPSPKS